MATIKKHKTYITTPSKDEEEQNTNNRNNRSKRRRSDHFVFKNSWDFGNHVSETTVKGEDIDGIVKERRVNIVGETIVSPRNHSEESDEITKQIKHIEMLPLSPEKMRALQAQILEEDGSSTSCSSGGSYYHNENYQMMMKSPNKMLESGNLLPHKQLNGLKNQSPPSSPGSGRNGYKSMKRSVSAEVMSRGLIQPKKEESEESSVNTIEDSQSTSPITDSPCRSKRGQMKKIKSDVFAPIKKRSKSEREEVRPATSPLPPDTHLRINSEILQSKKSKESLDLHRKTKVEYEQTIRGRIIVSATVDQLITHLYRNTSSGKETTTDPQLADIFILVHTLFLPTEKFFDRLTSAFHRRMNIPVTKEVHEIRIRIINVVKKLARLVDHYVELKPKIKRFVENLKEQKTPEYSAWAKLIDGSTYELSEKERYQPTVLVPPVLPRITDPSQFTFINLDTSELARQMTLMDQAMFQDIGPKEMLNSNWLRDSGPNLKKILEHASTISEWVRTEVATTANFKGRVTTLSKFICLNEILIEYQNFNSALSLYVGLELLKFIPDEWKKLTPKLKQKWKAIQGLLSLSRDFQALRQKFSTASGSVIVPLSILLHDLLLIEEQPLFIPNTNAVNFTKCRQIFGVYKFILNTKYCDYPFVPIQSIQEYLEKHIKSTLQNNELDKIIKNLQGDNCKS